MKELIKQTILNKHIYQLCSRYINLYRNDNNGNPYSNGEFDLLRQYITDKQSPVVFDIGASIGEWTLFVLGVNSEAKIHCFERCSKTFLELENKLSRLPKKKIATNHLALGSEVGNLEILIYGETSELNSIYHRETLGQSISKELVKVDTLDNYCQQRDIEQINFCKLDVEGHELEVLKGARRLISKGAINLIQFEYGGTYIDSRILLKDVFSFFEGLPYRLFKIFPRDLQPVSSYEVGLETFKYSNWVALLNSDNDL